MHPNAHLLDTLFSSLNGHDHQTMAACYHPDATFYDIAFDLRGRDQIRSMWRMICSGDIRCKFEVTQADSAVGLAKVVDDYTFKESGRHVTNPIESRFRFHDGLIVEHTDFCDARAWAAAAVGGLGGFLAGRFRFLRARKAQAKLERFTS